MSARTLIEAVLKISVPSFAQSAFFQDHGADEEFWAFKSKPSARPGDTIQFTFGSKSVARAIVSRVEPPGESECGHSGKFKERWKVHWKDASFQRLSESQRLIESDVPAPVAPVSDRATKIARIKELGVQIKALSAKGGLTRVEADRFRSLAAEANSLRFDVSKPPALDDLSPEEERQSTLTPDILLTARHDLMRSKAVYTPIIDAAIGVSFNAETAVDEVMQGKNKVITPQQFYAAFAATRAAMRQHFGNTITLFRATGKQRAKPTQNWATTREFAQSFGANVIEANIPIEKVLAVNVSKNGRYHEIIVGEPPAQSMSEGRQRDQGWLAQDGTFTPTEHSHNRDALRRFGMMMDDMFEAGYVRVSYVHDTLYAHREGGGINALQKRLLVQMAQDGDYQRLLFDAGDGDDHTLWSTSDML